MGTVAKAAVVGLLAWSGSAWADWQPGPRTARDYTRGVAALDVGELDVAEVEFRRVLQREPDCGLARHGLGLSLLRQNRKAEAFTAMEQLVSDWPQEPDAWTGLSIAAFAAQDFDRALQAGERAVALDPASLEAQVALQEALLRQGDLPRARAALAAAALPPASLACLEAQVDLEAGELQAAQARIPACEEAPPGLSVPVRNQVAAASGQVAQAGELARRMGLSATAGVAQAVDAYQAGQPAQALSILDQVLELEPGRTDARLLRGRIRHEQGDLPGAVADLEAAIGGQAWVDVAWTGAMSGVLRQSHEADLADRVAEGAERLLHILVDQGQLDLAAQRLADLQAELGTRPELYAAEARLRLAQGQPEAAHLALARGLPAGTDRFPWQEAAASIVVSAPEGLHPEVARALSRSSQWGHRYNLALARYKRGEHDAVEELAKDTLQELGAGMPEAGIEQLASLAHAAAVKANDLEAADAWAARLGRTEPLQEVARINHSLLRLNADDAEGALAMLRDLEPTSDQADGLVQTVRIRALVALDRLDEATRLATNTNVSPGEVWWLGSQLAASNNLSGARELLGRACPRLVGEQASQCSQLLLELGGPL